MLKRLNFGILLLAFLLSYSAFSVETRRGIGVEGGLSFGNARTPGEISSSTRTGFMGGLMAEIGLTPGLSLQPELLYAQRGFNYIETSGIDVSAHYDSIQVPVLLRANFGEKIVPFLFAGPVAIFNINRNISVDAAGTTASASFNPRTTDFGVDLGGGIAVSPLFATLRYSVGLIDVDENQGNWQSRGLQLLLGFELGS